MDKEQTIDSDLNLRDSVVSDVASGKIPGAKAALVLGIISIVAAGPAGLVLSIISRNKVKAGKELFQSNPEKYEQDRKTLLGAEKCAKIGLILSIIFIPLTILNIGYNIASL